MNSTPSANGAGHGGQGVADDCHRRAAFDQGHRADAAPEQENAANDARPHAAGLVHALRCKHWPGTGAPALPFSAYAVADTELEFVTELQEQKNHDMATHRGPGR